MSPSVSSDRYTEPTDTNANADAHVSIGAVVHNGGAHAAEAVRLIPQAPLAEPAGAARDDRAL